MTYDEGPTIVGEKDDTYRLLPHYFLFTMMIDERRNIASSTTAPSAHRYEFEENDKSCCQRPTAYGLRPMKQWCNRWPKDVS